MALTTILLAAYGAGVLLARHGIVRGVTLAVVAALSFSLTSWLHRFGSRGRDTDF